MENTIKSNHPVTGRTGKVDGAGSGAAYTADGLAQSNNPVGGDMVNDASRVVIVGGGFGGLAAAKALRRSPVHVTLIDRTNHHLFQPLLYQVATFVLAPGQVAAPIRDILGKQRNTTVILGEVTAVNKEQRYIVASSADLTDPPRPGRAFAGDNNGITENLIHR